MEFKTNLSYPRSDEYDYFAQLIRINLDEECDKDLSNQHGFIIKEQQSVIKALKSEDSIFSSRFGRSLQDKDPYSNRYSCTYGCTQGAFYAVPDDANWVCPICGTEVKLVGDDFTYFGWIRIKRKLIHPTMYITLSSLIGVNNLEAIIEPEVELDSNGNPVSLYDKRLLKKKNARRYKKKAKIDETYAGIGMIKFVEKFDEICKYFLKKKPNKKDIYDDIMENKDIVFTHSIPVYTTQLRIAKVENRRFTFESTNAEFNMLAKLAAKVNTDDLSIYRNVKYQNQLLWDMQFRITKLTKEIIKILSGKKGIIRSTISGRAAFSERSVIVPNAKLRMDEITLPYFGLCILLEQVIINILQKSYNITYAAAYKIWYYASLEVDKRVYDIIMNLIRANKINVLINRNPTIYYQSMVFKRVVDMTLDFTMGIDIYCLDGLGADFDGDTLNIKLLYNKKFADACERIYSPRNAFCISRNDGRMNSMVNVFKDIVINMNALIDLGRDNYSDEQLEKIHYIQEKYKNIV